jgi:hypothetical protein
VTFSASVSPLPFFHNIFSLLNSTEMTLIDFPLSFASVKLSRKLMCVVVHDHPGMNPCCVCSSSDCIFDYRFQHFAEDTPQFHWPVVAYPSFTSLLMTLDLCHTLSLFWHLALLVHHSVLDYRCQYLAVDTHQ